MKKLLIFVAMLSLCLVFVCCQPKQPQTYYSLYNDLTTKISRAADEQLRKEIPDLRPSGSGGQIKDKQVVFRAFDIPREIDEESGRNLILRITNAYLEAFNSSEEFRPFIRQFPFKNTNLHINLFFSTPTHGTLPSGKICVISLMDGNIRYDAHNPNDTFKSHVDGQTLSRLMTLHEETYEEAIQKSQVGKE